MADTLITFTIIALAAGYLLFRRLKKKKGQSSCGCGEGCDACAGNPSVSCCNDSRPPACGAGEKTR